MYIVVDKNTNRIIHINNAPLSQNLSDKEVYFDFNPDTMKIGKTDDVLPEHWVIDDNGYIREMTIQEKVKVGIIKLGKTQKVLNGKIVDKSIDELYKEKITSLEEYRLKKLERIRNIRNQILFQTDWIQIFLAGEQEAINVGLLSEDNRKWIREEIKKFLQWRQFLRDLPQTVNVDKYELDEINPENKELFPSCPLLNVRSEL